jgi:hypothetical protein
MTRQGELRATLATAAGTRRHCLLPHCRRTLTTNVRDLPCRAKYRARSHRLPDAGFTRAVRVPCRGVPRRCR